MVCLSDNGSELKNHQMNIVLKQLGIKHIFSNPYRPQGNSCIENVHNFLKRTLTKFLSSTDVEWVRSYHLPATVLTQSLQLITWKAQFSWFMVETC